MNDIDFDIILTFSIDKSFDFFFYKWVVMWSMWPAVLELEVSYRIKLTMIPVFLRAVNI